MRGPRVEVVDATELDYASFCLLQKEAAGDDTPFGSPASARWALTPPAGSARIALATEGTRVVAATAMCPHHVRAGGAATPAWAACAAATAADSRGRGLFARCLRALIEELEQDEVLFGFSSPAAAPALEHLGWRRQESVATWMSPLTLPPLWMPEGVEESSRFGEGHDVLAGRLGLAAAPLLDRGAAYLTWRYAEHPVHRYTSLALHRSGELVGFAVIRSARVLGRDAILVTELWGLEREFERALLAHIRGLAWNRSASLVVLRSAEFSWQAALAGALLPAPARLLGSPQALLGMGTGPRAAAVLGRRWRIQAGDSLAF